MLRLAFDFSFLVFLTLADASAAKSLKLISWFEKRMLPNDEAANWLAEFFLACSIRLTCWLAVVEGPVWVAPLKKWFALLDDAVDVEDETDEDSNAAGVSSNGNVVGDNGGSEDVVELDALDEVDDDVDEDRDDLDERVDAADDDEWCEDDEVYLFNSFSLLVNVKWLGLRIRFELESPK